MGFASRAAPTSSLRLGAAAPLPSKVSHVYLLLN